MTALRWARLLTSLGHRVTVAQMYEGQAYDLLVALHARRSHESIIRFHRAHPDAPIIVALTGTDLYSDLRRSGQARQSLEIATRIVVLQPKGVDELYPPLRDKTRVIYQSAAAIPGAANRTREKDTAQLDLTSGGSSACRNFEVCVIGHLRAVKDPFRTALAARLLPPSSHLRVLHVGGAMNEKMAAWARVEMETNSRYRWLGEQPPWRTRRILTQSRLCVLSSRIEGGANVLSEAMVAGVPIIASQIPGTEGILGANYPGYFSVGRTRELARLLLRAETDAAFLAKLRAQGQKLASLFDPAREARAWADLLGEVFR